VKVSSRFKGTRMLRFIESINADDLDDSFNPYKLKEKWQRFFRG
jgi:hypothetical protein